MAGRTLQSTIEIAGTLSPSLQQAIRQAIDRLTAHLEQAIQESEDAWKLASREFTDGWRKVSNPKSRHPAVVETLKNNNRLTRKVKAAKARHERWVKIKALWADTAL